MYGQSWDDLGTTPPARAWQMLRSLRHAPPGAAQQARRKVVFDAALEQAEQLFAAATSVTPATSPLLLFYGLSQAGRAVAAAAVGKHNVDRWELRRHGITNKNLSAVDPKTLSSLKVTNAGDGSFTRIADILGAASLPTAVELGDLWCLLPESSAFPLPGMGSARPINIDPLHPYDSPTQPNFTAVVPIPHEFLSMADVGQDPSGVSVNWLEKQAAVRAYLARFPSLGKFDFPGGEGQPISIRGYGDKITLVEIVLPKPASMSKDEALLQHTTKYRSGNLAFPAVGSDGRPPHPFVLWWAILFSLSMLARYEPSSWATLISVNSSPAAIAIEHLLQESMVVLPELIHRTIYEVA